MGKEIFGRMELLVGSDAMARMAAKRVIVFGVGGVGSWCAESLVRSGIEQLTLVDADHVGVSNINRQLMATTATVGQSKVEVLRRRLLTINPDADIATRHEVFCEQTAADFHLDRYDFIIDAIDSLGDKALLIEMACQTRATLFSSMGAALKIDPLRIKVAEFWKVKGDPLARALRNRFKKQGHFPKRKFQCVFSDEQLKNQELPPAGETAGLSCFKKVHVNGTVAHITAIFGFMLASLVVNAVVKETPAPSASQ